MSLIIKDGSPIIDNYVYVYAHEEKGLSSESIFKIHNHHGGSPEQGKYSIQNDILINILYFAAIRAKVEMKVFGLDDEDYIIDSKILKSLEVTIDQLSILFAYKNQIINLEKFSQNFKDQTIYYSTLAGDDTEGQQKLFVCTSSSDNIMYYPVFLSEEHMMEFFNKYQRSAYMILHDNLQHFLSVLDTNSNLKELGVVIEPLYHFNTTIPPLFRIKQ